MEIRKPRHDLKQFQASDYRITQTAITSALAMGFDIDGVDEVVQSMRPEHFYKSMTSYHDHTQWQDVYHVPYGEWLIYVKFTSDKISDFKLLSFKEK